MPVRTALEIEIRYAHHTPHTIRNGQWQEQTFKLSVVEPSVPAGSNKRKQFWKPEVKNTAKLYGDALV